MGVGLSCAYHFFIMEIWGSSKAHDHVLLIYGKYCFSGLFLKGGTSRMPFILPGTRRYHRIKISLVLIRGEGWEHKSPSQLAERSMKWFFLVSAYCLQWGRRLLGADDWYKGSGSSKPSPDCILPYTYTDRLSAVPTGKWGKLTS